MDPETSVDRLVSIDVAARFEGLQAEVDLLKVEIKQTLVDLREFMMKARTIFPQTFPGVPMADDEGGQMDDHARDEEEPGASVDDKPGGVHRAEGSPQSRQIERKGESALDPAMLREFIGWLGGVKRQGLSLQQITPYLEAYEGSGYLAPLMVKFILRSMADLDRFAPVLPDQEFSPEDYSECLTRLHDIVCGPGKEAHPLFPVSSAEPADSTSNGTAGKARFDRNMMTKDVVRPPRQTEQSEEGL